MAAMPIYGKEKKIKNLLLRNQESFEAESWYIASEGTKNLLNLLHGQIYVLVAVAVLEECCMATAGMQWLFYSGEQIVAHGPLVFMFQKK